MGWDHVRYARRVGKRSMWVLHFLGFILSTAIFTDRIA